MLYKYISLSIYLYLSLSIYLSIYLSLCLYLSIYISLSLYIYIYIQNPCAPGSIPNHLTGVDRRCDGEAELQPTISSNIKLVVSVQLQSIRTDDDKVHESSLSLSLSWGKQRDRRD